MYKRYVHINYFEHRYSNEDAFCHAAQIGYDGIEVRDRDRSGAVGLEHWLEETARLAADHGLALVYGCRVATTHPEEEERRKSVAHFHEVVAHSHSLGQTLVNVFTGLLWREGATYSTSGSALATPRDWEIAVETMQETADFFPEMTFAMETHSGYIHDVARPTREFLDRVDRSNVCANFDYANMFLNRRGESMDEAIAALSGKIGYIHLKNAQVTDEMPEGIFNRVPLEEGTIDIPRQLSALLQKGVYTGTAICVENTMQADKLPVARQDYAALTRWLAEA